MAKKGGEKRGARGVLWWGEGLKTQIGGFRAHKNGLPAPFIVPPDPNTWKSESRKPEMGIWGYEKKTKFSKKWEWE